MATVPRLSLLALLLLVAGLGLPAAAGAATVTVRADPGSVEADDPRGLPTRDEVFYVAAPGERNRLLVSYASDALAVTVSDPGAVIVPGPSCTAVDAHTARCVPRAGGLSTFLQAARAELGDLDDEVRTFRATPFPIGGVNANGGPGDDLLIGGPGDDVLDGGGGRDDVRGGADDDLLADGDRDGAAGDGAPGPDRLDGGAGRDEISYRGRTAPVSVDLSRGGTSGAEGEGDVVRGFEDVTGGRGADRLGGDGRANRLAGGRGADTLLGRGGPDELNPFASSKGDTITCGTGTDVVFRPGSRVLVEPRCEQVVVAFPGTETGLKRYTAYPRRSGPGTLRYSVDCGFDEDLDGPGTCGGTVTLREAGGRKRVLASGTLPRGQRLRTAVLPLTPLGCRLVNRAGGVTATLRIAGSGLAPATWRIRLR